MRTILGPGLDQSLSSWQRCTWPLTNKFINYLFKFPLNLINKLTATLAFNGTLILNYYIMFVKNMVRRRACRLPASLSHPPFATVVEILLALKKMGYFHFSETI